jgi:hypothetical protein
MSAIKNGPAKGTPTDFSVESVHLKCAHEPHRFSGVRRGYEFDARHGFELDSAWRKEKCSAPLSNLFADAGPSIVNPNRFDQSNTSVPCGGAQPR